MAEVKKARLFLRRGTDTDRKTTTLCEGELGYSTDAFRVVVGDGSSRGGKSLGTTAFISGGSDFYPTLSAGAYAGYAHKGDFALFPSNTYDNAAGTTVTTANSGTVVMVLTANQVPGSETQTTPGSWVAVNSGIPWGNLCVEDDDISGNKIYGGNISGDILFTDTLSVGDGVGSTSVYLSAVGLSAQNTVGLSGTRIYPIGITSTSQLTALSSIYEFDILQQEAEQIAIINFVAPTTVFKSTTLVNPARTSFTEYDGASGTPVIPSTARNVILQTTLNIKTDNRVVIARYRNSGSGQQYILGAGRDGTSKDQHLGVTQTTVPLVPGSRSFYYQIKIGQSYSDTTNDVVTAKTTFAGHVKIEIVGYTL